MRIDAARRDCTSSSLDRFVNMSDAPSSAWIRQTGERFGPPTSGFGHGQSGARGTYEINYDDSGGITSLRAISMAWESR